MPQGQKRQSKAIVRKITWAPVASFLPHCRNGNKKYLRKNGRPCGKKRLVGWQTLIFANSVLGQTRISAGIYGWQALTFAGFR